MPVSGGEVSAKLKLTYQSDLKAAKAEVAEIQSYLNGVQQDKNPAAFAMWTSELDKAKGKVVEIQGKLEGLKNPIKDVNEGLGSTEGIIQRMALRLAALYAARGAFDFVKDVFETSQQLVNLNEQLGLTITTLQTLQFGSEETGVKFDKVTQSIVTLDKNVDEMKVSTLDALNQLGLSFDSIINLNPDERFRAIATALEGISDPVKRGRLELELFGTEGIDPLIVKFKELDNQSSAKSLAEETPKNLSVTTSYYKEFYSNLKTQAAEWLDVSQRAAKVVAEGFGAGGANGFKDALQEIKDFSQAFKDAGGDIDLLANAYNNILKAREKASQDINLPRELSEQEKLNAILTEQSHVVEKLTADQKQSMDVLHQAGLDTEQNAVRLGLTVLQWKEYEKAVKQGDEALKKFNTEQEQEAKKAEAAHTQMMRNWEEETARLEKLTADADKEAEKTQVNRLQLQDKYNKALEADDLSHLERMRQQGLISERDYQSERIIIATEYSNKHELIRQQEHNHELAALEDSETKEIAQQKKLLNEKKITEEEYEQNITEIHRKYVEKRQQIDDGFDEATKEKRLKDIQEIEDVSERLAAADKKRFDDWLKQDTERRNKEQHSYAQDVTAYNIDTISNEMGLNLGTVLDLAKEGYSFAEIIQVIRTGKKGKPVGPRIPGFQSGIENYAGGEAVVGENGPEVLNLPGGSSVTPMNKAIGGHISIHNHFYGTPEQQARDVELRIMKNLRGFRQLPAGAQGIRF